MDTDFSDLFLQDCETPLDFDSVSDAGYFSACDGLSPASSAAEGSSCSSPTWSPSPGASDWSSPLSPLWSSSPGLGGPEETAVRSHSVQLHGATVLGSQEQTGGFKHPEHQATAQTYSNIEPIQLRVPALPSLQQQGAAFPLQEQTQTQTPQLQDGKRSRCRSRYPGRKRHNASEREKLRMRDLTKALHHLRTYLPPSVAPAGQTLTKIQTLRLAIRYIAHLSAQVEASYVDTGVRMEQGLELCHTYATAKPQGLLHEHLPDQHIHCPQQQPASHWSQLRHQYTPQSGQYAPCHQNHQASITDCLTSAVQQDRTIYQKQNLVPLSHGFCYSPYQL